MRLWFKDFTEKKSQELRIAKADQSTQKVQGTRAVWKTPDQKGNWRQGMQALDKEEEQRADFSKQKLWHLFFNVLKLSISINIVAEIQVYLAKS